LKKVLSSSDNLIPRSAGVKGQAAQGGSTAHATPASFCPFQRHYLITRRILQCPWSELDCQTFLTNSFITKRDVISRVIEGCDGDRQRTRTPNRTDVSGTGIRLPVRADVSEAAVGPCRLQPCAMLGSSRIGLSE
jgi:hypothetical protein